MFWANRKTAVLVFLSGMASIAIGFQNCSKVEFSQGENQIAESPQGSVKLKGFVVDWLIRHFGQYYGTNPSMIIAGLKIYIKKGLPNSLDTKSQPIFATATTDINGYFEFNSIPTGVYTVFWDVPDHYYSPNNDMAGIEVQETSGEKDISSSIIVFRHGLVFRCISHEGNSVENIRVKLYESKVPYEYNKLNDVILGEAITNSMGVFYMDTAEIIPASITSGGVLVFSRDGVEIGWTGLESVNYQTLWGIDPCGNRH